MPILRDVAYTLTVETLLEVEGRGRPRPALVAAAEEAIRLGRQLFDPAAVYDEFVLCAVVGERVELTGTVTAPGAGLDVGPMATLLVPAEQLLLAIYTVGPTLEARVSVLQRAGETLLAYMLDSVGVLALALVGERLYRLAEERAEERGWGVGPALSPGSLAGWPVQGQRELCALLPIECIGLRLNEHAVLLPYKSVSIVIGLGPGYEAHTVGSLCQHCALRDNCKVFSQ